MHGACHFAAISYTTYNNQIPSICIQPCFRLHGGLLIRVCSYNLVKVIFLFS